MNNVYLHFGAHKTGSTLFQKWLKENNDFFHESNVELYVKKDLKEELGEWASWSIEEKELTSRFPQKFNNFLQSVDGKKDVLISYEGFLGGLDLSKSGVIYPNASKICSLFSDGLKESNVKVSFSIRSYDEFIESSYKWLVKHGMGKQFKKYHLGIKKDGFSWAPVVDSIVGNFGEENVFLWDYEDYKQSPQEMHKKIMSFYYGRNINHDFQIPGEEMVNVSFGKIPLRLSRAFNEEINKTPSLNPQDRKKAKRAMRKVLESQFNEGEMGGKPILLNDIEIKEWREKYREDISRLKEKYSQAFYVGV
ncbi:hypothetical protein [Halomonas salipaludis]|uniref:hypothetical protein n=1 Tax=Halomonas salipaludis TaxID=2032625 RepID=UPI00114096B1|nr:hypothetical protein [Halomonas salipaludis]